MKIRAAILAIFAGLCPLDPALADAWLRDNGSWFLAVSHFTDVNDRTTYDSLLIEYGLSPTITLGLDAGLDDGAAPAAVAYGRLPISIGQSNISFTTELGAGSDRDGQAIARVGLAAGNGVETRFGSGWWSVDSTADIALGASQATGKIDATAGWNVSDNAMVILQMQGGGGSNQDEYVKLAPSYARKFGDHTHVELGMSADLTGRDKVELKLGSWFSF